ncbi:hypothetical protein H2O64_19145 [Kordia sp. YSTF-M3]|uniref:TonB-dependent receptor plug domain-containing protein n=1 Tax=Kordia aestuariivivens TaxID=2759037 RepID=A0ABR7QE51_9FLAO|nr:hypothetical protein [Kordia aestuariivivens]MBC8756798.1 hypothetical protein [Kordia aestuariivivens]
MKKKYLLLFIAITTIFSVFGQQEKNIEDEYSAYFTLPRESLYLHLNKTSYFTGEEIWFKGYTYDKKNQLTSKATTNINVGIYDETGKQLKKALFKAENGVAQGNFSVDSTFVAGTYYIKAETNWMKNFKENDAYIQKIEVFTEQETIKNNVYTDEQFDFQFLPEGGHIVANTLSNVGFKVINDQGKGVSVSGIVYDEDQKQVASFEGNPLGMGKFLFQPKANHQYTAEIKLENGTILTETLPKAKETGISMILNNPFPDKIIINFSTNEKTLAYNPSKQYKVLIHQNGNLKTLLLTFDDATEKIISVPKKDVFKGVNTITVFDNNENPILERLFFNDYFVKKANLNISKLNTVNDSILLSINELALQENANISISVLPETTKSYNPKHNILSNFYLKPHIKGFVENPQYYFYNMNRKKKYELDILLLTQGWSRYDWNDIFGSKPNGLNRFENGITIRGRVNKPTSGIDRLFLHATKNHSARFITLEEDQKFTLENFFLEEGEEIRFSYATKKGIFRKPSMYLRFNITNKEDQISEVILNDTKTTNTASASFSLPKDFIYKNTEVLDEVVVKTDKRTKYRDPILQNGVVTDITLEEYNRFYNITDFIGFNGFYQVSEQLGRVSIVTRRRPQASPVIYFDDVRLLNFNILSNFSTANVERIIMDRNGIGEGMNAGFGGVIKIYTRKTPLFKRGEGEEMYLGSKAPFAFATTKKYYAPKYASFQSDVFQEYGAISWIPELKLEKAQASNFKIYDTKTDNITLYIEGISENGDLISEKKTIQIR